MKLLAIRSARAIWFVPTAYLNPRGRYLIPVVGALIERYRFQKPPDSQSLFASPLSVKFEGGLFTGEDGVDRYLSLSIHDDGLVAEVRSSTEEADAVLHEALIWLAAEFQLRPYTELNIRKLHISELSVQFDGPLSILNPSLAKFTEALSPLELLHVNFGSDPSLGGPQRQFRIEREVGSAFGEKRYWSSAAMHTAEHMRLLQDFERAALS